jgi:hypothetical protein
MLRSGERKRRRARVSLGMAIPSALRKNREKLGQPDGPLGDFIRLIKLKLHFVDDDREPPSVTWVDGWQ